MLPIDPTIARWSDLLFACCVLVMMAGCQGQDESAVDGAVFGGE